MSPPWLARELRALFLSLCPWTVLHFSIKHWKKKVKRLLQKWPPENTRVNPMDWKYNVPVKDDVWASSSRRRVTIVFVTNVDRLCFFVFSVFYFYIFLYGITIPDPDVLLFHLESLLFSVFPYMYICMYPGHSVPCLLGPLRFFDSFPCVCKRENVFLALFIKLAAVLWQEWTKHSITSFCAIKL